LRQAIIPFWLFLLFLSPAALAQTGFSKLIAWGQWASSTVPCPPGNSLPHIDFCYQLGYEGEEIDVMISKDNIPVVAHEVVVNGTNYSADHFTFEELQQLTIGTWQGAPVRIPTLEEALRTNGTRGPFMADMRVDSSLAWAVSNAVKQAGFDENLLAITAYGIEPGLVFKHTFPHARVFVKAYAYPADISRTNIDAIAAAGLDGVMLQMPEDGQSIQDFVDYVHCQGLRLTLFVHYGYHTLAQLQALVDVGTDYILTVHHDFRPLINWLAPDLQAPRLRFSFDLPHGEISLSWQHQRPYAHRLQSSSDLKHWADAGVAVDGTNAPTMVQCVVPMTGTKGFYRLGFEP